MLEKIDEDAGSENNNRAIEFDPDVPVVSVSGGGMLLPSYFGALNAIKEVRGNSPTIYASFSSGALASAISLCDLDTETVLILYSKFMEEQRVSKRLLGMAFVWGDITRKWLEEILPEKAAELCEGFLVVQFMEWRGIREGLQMRRVKNFPNRSVLIDTLLASCHIPFFLDGRPWTKVTTEEGEPPYGKYIAIDSFIVYALKMQKSKQARIKYRISTDTERKSDITLSYKFDELLKNGPGLSDVISCEQGMQLRDKGYHHTMARLTAPKFSHLISDKV